jgi:hypothetical protein
MKPLFSIQVPASLQLAGVNGSSLQLEKVLFKSLFSIFLLAFSFLLNAQQDSVILKDGKLFTGKITAYQVGTELKIIGDNGVEINVPDDKIQTVKLSTSPIKMANKYHSKKRGFYGSANTAIYFGSTGETNYTTAGVQVSGGYRIFPWLMVGFGLDFMPHFGQMSVSDYNLIPKLELKGAIGKGRVAPYYHMGIGYGLPLDRKHDNPSYDTKYDGSLFLHPALGVRVGVGKNADLTFDLGYIFYSPSYTHTSTGNQFWSNTYTYSYKSFVLRFGASF